MKLIRPITENEMVATFIFGEIQSKRFRRRYLTALRQLKAPIGIVLDPNLESKRENAMRARLLSLARGYKTGHTGMDGHKTVFNTFPISGVKWYRAALTKNELMRVKYINWPAGWTHSVSNGTRLPIKGVDSLKKGSWLLSFSEAFAKGEKFPELIIVSASPKSRLVVLEGHGRLTGMMHSKEHLPREIEVILGISKKVRSWILY